MNLNVGKKGILPLQPDSPSVLETEEIDNDLHLNKIKRNVEGGKFLNENQVENLLSITKNDGSKLIQVKDFKSSVDFKDDYADFIYELMNIISSLKFDELYNYFYNNSNKNYNDLILNSPLMKDSIKEYEIEREIIKFEPTIFGGPPCKFCKESNTKVVTMQLRSRDEGETVIYICGSNACGKSWRR